MVTRARLREEIRRKVQKIYLRFNNKTGNVGGLVRFTNGAARFIIFTGDEIITATPNEPGSIGDLLAKEEPE